MSDDWNSHWSRFGQASAAGPTPKYRHRLILSELRLPKTKSFVLEIGCGLGDFAEYLLKRKRNVCYYGVDPSEEAMWWCHKRNLEGASFCVRDITVDTWTHRFATHAVCSEVVEHLDHPEKLIEAAAASMVSGCRFVVTAPGGPMNEFYREIGHRRHYTPRELKELVESSGPFRVETYGGYGWPFFNLFRLLLTLSGKKAIEASEGTPSLLTRMVMQMFHLLFYFNLPFGWQSVVVAIRKP